MEERSELNEEAEEMAMLSFGTTGNATTYHNRANILYPSEKKKVYREVDTDQKY